ncbi:MULTISPECIES: hypothetical protein [Bacillus cereus group]|uniref:Uncharacterized protein n=1 Tax=Bacillus thuringiensis TaxID=1428 RepID=A0A9W3YLB1_BACTU|nr:MULTISPECIES: hypothetical protein [Bacillus cereus group]AMR05933.1 hypothetical protein AXW78_28000 [Bacillus thuringiensis]AYF85336.1 hypothetical protein D7J84_30630 [Bacillus thuringiensis]KLA33602.1 hypothetical protein B4080_6101 [Bacillus cereus]PNK30635.1 hypothetical protein CBR55_30660 [Bacillus thuringiensis]
MIIISLLMYVSNAKWLVQMLKLVIFILNKLANWEIDKERTSNRLISFIIYSANKFFRKKGIC